jgi:Helix-turn-helix domain
MCFSPPFVCFTESRSWSVRLSPGAETPRTLGMEHCSAKTRLGEDVVRTPEIRDIDATPERAELAHEIKRLRDEHGLSKRQLADIVKYDPKVIRDAENPDKRVPSEGAIAAIDITLDAQGHLVELRKRAYDAHMKRREALKNIAVSSTTLAMSSGIEDLLEIIERIVRSQPDYVPSGLVDELERLANASIGDYEWKHSAVLAPGVTRVRRWVDSLLRGKQAAPEQERLRVVACKLSGVLSTVSGDLGDPDRARVYSLEAYIDAKKVGDPDLVAWSRARQARAAHDACDLTNAIELARQLDGKWRPHTARLAFNEALTLARMGDRRGVANAIARGMSSCVDTANGVYSAVTLDPYDFRYAARWACSAYATLGDTAKTQEYAEQVLSIFDRENMASSSFIRLELAATVADSDPRHAGELVIAATDAITQHPVASITPKITDFLAAAQSPKIRNIPAFRSAVDAAQTALRQLGQKRV